MTRTSGAITGTPTAAASSSVTVTASDSSTPNQATVSKTFTLTVKAAKLQITTASLPSGAVNQPYSATVSATGGTGAYTWSATRLPTNVTINATTGALSGTPTKAGTSTVRITVTDSANPTNTSSASLVVAVTS